MDRYLELRVIILEWAMLPFVKENKSIKSPAQKSLQFQDWKLILFIPLLQIVLI